MVTKWIITICEVLIDLCDLLNYLARYDLVNIILIYVKKEQF